MANSDTIKLLKECDAGSKMAVSSIDDVVEKIRNSSMKSLLQESKAHHEKLGNELHSLLNQYGKSEKDPNPMAKGMSWMKTNVMMTVGDDSDATAADLITDGCNMGIKSLYRYLNQYKEADHTSKDICNRLISIEQELRKGLRDYL